ncbi:MULTISPECIES: DUF6452 family protein [Chryseobacterium]|jgi:hypothetical protein|uniref:Lipoprotein n=1 Tax=Chryseobacterium geocarposphaerae TaxID=1416776 RepID=A0ABU1LGH8_9FLAO|nr:MULTISPECIES: DUF6452 family protein [Chryseobacterium]ALR31444.1 hypothetical protein ATE47_13360 [Chryseobacterium sp. IHB B 17019]MDR6405831.1 hypothetical protein [Chryseobacterium geocarposphaerae]MDR6699005.1 hypothetical protein [Chryseobacterium ginsenosidimutans]
MKYFKFLIAVCFIGLLFSCGGDDDICESGEGTPRMKVSFKNFETGKEKTLDSLYVAVDYGSGKVQLGKQTAITSRVIPLRVDDSPYTDVYFRVSDKGTESKIRINYTTKSTYVSPGCGVKKTYENLNSVLDPTTTTPVKSIEAGQNFIENEDKTNLYLLF